MKFYLLIIVSTVFLSSCFHNNNDKKHNIALGAKVFAKECEVCHGFKGRGITKDWKKAVNGNKYPPPPLNGTAHTWHHSRALLLRIINDGGANLGGSMPAFKNKLSEEEKQSLLNYMYDLWDEKIKKIYNKRFN